MSAATDLQRWRARVAASEQERREADRDTTQQLTASACLERGLALSLFAARMREAFRDRGSGT
jgi:hypothetical protein